MTAFLEFPLILAKPKATPVLEMSIKEHEIEPAGIIY